MHNLFVKIGAVIVGLGMMVGSWFGYAPVKTAPVQSNQVNQVQLGNVQLVAGSTYILAGSGISFSATSLTLNSFTIPQTGTAIVNGDLSNPFYVTIEPGNTSRQEIVSCTTVTQNANSTATLSGCTRGLSPIYPYTASSTLRFTHAGGSQVIFSNPPQVFNLYTAKSNDETVSGSWSFPTPTGSSNPVTLGYLNQVVLGSTTADRISAAGTAGETIATGSLLYLDTASGRWYNANANSRPSIFDTINGIAQGSGTAGTAINGGVLLHGLDGNQSGLTAGKNYFASTTTGAIGLATTTKSVGKAKDSTHLYFDTFSIDSVRPSFSGTNTFTGLNSFSATTTMASTSIPELRVTTCVGGCGATSTSVFALPAFFTGSTTLAQVNSNTSLRLGQVQFVQRINVKFISFSTPTVTQAGSQGIFALWTQDGRTQLFSTTTTITTPITTINFSAAPIVITPGKYYLGMLGNGNANFNVVMYSYSGGDEVLGDTISGVSGGDIYSGSLTVSASTMPSTITPSAITGAAGANTLYGRFDD